LAQWYRQPAVVLTLTPSQIKLVGIGLTVLFILQWQWNPDPFGCESIERLLSQVRHEHPPRWTIIQQHDMKMSAILREPLAHAISYYNFFHKHQVNAATENMSKEHVVANPQCATLSHYKKKKMVVLITVGCHGCKNLCRIVQDFTTTF
jgi:hypothetical protein